MKNFAMLLLLAFIISACENKTETPNKKPTNWNHRTLNTPLTDSLKAGATFLSVYSQIYSETEHKTHSLTATVSIRNINLKDTVYITQSEYFDTHGKAIRTYFNKPIYIAPMETVEIVINEIDREGGTGGNFVFNWKTHPDSNQPLFEAVMISTSGQQGLSFSTQGKQIH